MAELKKVVTLEQQKTILESIKSYIDNNTSNVTVDTELTEGGLNPVQGGIIKTYIDKALENVVTEDQLQEIEVDTEVKADSENPVQNKAIKTYVDTTLEDYLKKEDVKIGIDVKVVNALPESDISPTTIYLVEADGDNVAGNSDVYQQYMYISNAWVKLGTTALTLTGFVTEEALNTKLGDYITSEALGTTLNDYVTKEELDDSVAISEVEGNLIEKKDDGLYATVPEATEAEIKTLTDIFTTPTV